MPDFQRYAVYYLPDDPALADFGARWLGWDIATGAPVPQPPVQNIADVTKRPRRYGFHGTMKPPFRLAAGVTQSHLCEAMAQLAAQHRPAEVEGLEIAILGRFLALVPTSPGASLPDLAFACVSALDQFRQPASETELARRRAGGLTKTQEAMLTRWGYPYVGEEFRFHLTLSGPLPPDQLSKVANAARDLLPPVSQPFPIRSISLVGETADLQFHLIERFVLNGQL